ncbi:MAG: hypothetical protein KDE58_18675 [Caldilineaceae bacterium]|nr:hypothetical protein [Caldilineaceae bacterium]
MFITRKVITALWLMLLLSFVTPTPGQAHGGVVIDTGFTDHFEWLVSIDPYPTLLGEATLTLLVYDIATYEPMSDLTVQIYLAAPDAPRPCCQPETHRGPIDLIVDPEIYPGDYSNVVTFDQPGDWELQFVATAPETIGAKSFTLVVPLQIHATMGGSQPIPIDANATPDVAATATMFAQNVAEARQENSSQAALPSSQETTNAVDAPADSAPTLAVTRGTNWWLWGGLGLVPIVLIGWLILVSGPRDNESPDKESSDS